MLVDRSGTSILELSLVAPLMVLMVCGAGDAAVGFARKLALQQAAARAVEMTLAAGLTTTMDTVARSEAAGAAGVPLAQVAVAKWLECNGTVMSSIDDICASGIPARFVSVRVTDTYSSAFRSLLSGMGAGNWSAVPLTGFAEARVQ
ncbi:MAG: TadE/TadG family type IV pilus assembly protein [Pseudomonadota bacterium]